MNKYVVELIGYNDGLPYKEYETDNLDAARVALDIHRKQSPKVGHRIIQIIEEYPPA